MLSPQAASSSAGTSMSFFMASLLFFADDFNDLVEHDTATALLAEVDERIHPDRIGPGLGNLNGPLHPGNPGAIARRQDHDLCGAEVEEATVVRLDVPRDRESIRRHVGRRSERLRSRNALLEAID